MWNYEKRLQYPVRIKNPNPKLAQVIITQFGGPDGELAASMRYLAQRYTMPYKEVTGILTDIGTEAPEMFQTEKWMDKSDFSGFFLRSFTTFDRIKKWDESDNLKSAEKPYIIEVGEGDRTINLCVAIPVKFEYEA